MSPAKLFEPGDRALVTYADESYEVRIIGPAKCPAGAWRCFRKSKHQPPAGWGLEDGRIETIDPQYLTKLSSQIRYRIGKFDQLDRLMIMGSFPHLDPDEWTVYRVRVEWLDSPDDFHRAIIALLPITLEDLAAVDSVLEHFRPEIDRQVIKMIGELKKS